MAEPTQSGTFVGGLMRGWEFGKGIQRREAQEERQQARFEQEQELNNLQTEASRLELENARSQQRRDEAIRSLTASEQAYASGNEELAVDQLRQGLDSLDMDIEDVNPEYARSLDQLSRAMKNPGEADRGALVESANRVFRRQLTKGVGPLDEPIERDGRTISEITGKRIAEVAPAPTDDGQGNRIEPGIMARMEVTGKTPDGETVTWRAPVTANRSAREDDPAQGIPLEEITRQVVGRKQLMSGLAQSPEFRGILRTAKTRAGAEPKETLRTVTGESLGLSGGLFQVNSQTGKISSVVEPPETEAGYSIMTGEQLPNSNVTGGLYKVNNETGEPIELVSPDDARGGTGMRDLNASDENSMYRQSANLFGGVYDPETGELTGLTENTARRVQALANRASRLFAGGDAGTRSQAVTMAARDMGIDIERLRSQGGATPGTAGQRDGESNGNRSGDRPREGTTASTSGAEQGDGRDRRDIDLSGIEQRLSRFGENAVAERGADPQAVERIFDKAIQAIRRGKDPEAVQRRYLALVEAETDGSGNAAGQSRDARERDGSRATASTGNGDARPESTDERSDTAQSGGQSGGEGVTGEDLRQVLDRIRNASSGQSGGLPTGSRSRLQGGEPADRNVSERVREFLSRDGDRSASWGPADGTPEPVRYRDPRTGDEVTTQEIRRIAANTGLAPDAVIDRMSLERVR